MIPLEGHYMVADVTDILSNDATRLLSPIYSIDLSKDACFRFYYHMFGLSVGRLRIYIKPVSMDMELIIDEPKYIILQLFIYMFFYKKMMPKLSICLIEGTYCIKFRDRKKING